MLQDANLAAIAEELHKLNENIKSLSNMLERKFGGMDENNLNVTLYTDQPIMITNKESEEK